MRPAIEPVVDAAIRGLDEKLAALPPGPEMMGVWELKSLLGVVRQNWDDAAHMRVEELDRLAGLLLRGVPLVPETLRSRLLAAATLAGAERRDLRVSALERALDELREALIDLQSCLEEENGREAQALLRDTWDFLVTANKRRFSDISPW